MVLQSLFGSEDPAGSDGPQPSSPAISVENVTKTFVKRGGGEVTAVDGVSLDVSRGEIVGVLGPNGAGKSTLVKMICGVQFPTDGRVRVGGFDTQENLRAVHRKAGAVLEGARNVYWRMTVRENLGYFASLQGIHPDHDREHHETLMEEFDLASKADETANNLSRGMIQKLQIACALVRRYDILLLDEPTLGLDVEARRDLRNRLRDLAREEGKTLVVTSHDMDVVRTLCDRIVLMMDGEVLVDRPTSELSDLFESYTYEIVASSVDPETLTGAVSPATIADVQQRNGRVKFLVSADDPGRLFHVLEDLERAGARLKAAKEVEEDLEEVFLAFTSDAGTLSQRAVDSP